MKNLLYTLGLIALTMACETKAQSNDGAINSDVTPSTQTNPEQTLVREVVSVERFKSLMAANSDFYLLDVRTPEEFNGGHIEGAVNINFYDEDFDDQIQQLDKTKTVFVYCHSGKRSAKTAAKMQALEFHQVFDLDGGFFGLVAAAFYTE